MKELSWKEKGGAPSQGGEKWDSLVADYATLQSNWAGLHNSRHAAIPVMPQDLTPPLALLVQS